MKYKIKYTYDTGDSFSNEYGLEEYLELEWNNKDVVKENLKRIEEHYKQYSECKNYNSDVQAILISNKGKDWFVYKERIAVYDPNDKIKTHHRNFTIDKKDIPKMEKAGYKVIYLIDEMQAQNNIRLKTDEGKDWQIWAPWCGYFENLVSAEIEIEDNDMKIVI